MPVFDWPSFDCVLVFRTSPVFGECPLCRQASVYLVRVVVRLSVRGPRVWQISIAGGDASPH
eukprot:7534593-Pyramimonas_sp.AAC.1